MHDRVGRVGRRHLAGDAVERCGEEECLAHPRTAGNDAVDGRSKAHVEHAVGFVEDEHADLREAEGAALEQVLEPPGGCYDDVRARRVNGLLVQADAAIDRADPQGAGMRYLAQLLDDLRRELAGRRQHECCRPRPVGVDALDHRDAECEGLPRAGRRFDEHIAAGEHIADHELLYGEGFGDATARERAADGVGHAELGERCRQVRLLLGGM